MYFLKNRVNGLADWSVWVRVLTFWPGAARLWLCFMCCEISFLSSLVFQLDRTLLGRKHPSPSSFLRCHKDNRKNVPHYKTAVRGSTVLCQFVGVQTHLLHKPFIDRTFYPQLKSLVPKSNKSTFGTSEINRFLWQNLYTCLWENKI